MNRVQEANIAFANAAAEQRGQAAPADLRVRRPGAKAYWANILMLQLDAERRSARGEPTTEELYPKES